MPGANYMGGKRNAAKARVKDTTGRLEKSFFGQRRLCAASQASGRNNIPLEGSLGSANISLGHAKRKIPPPNNLITEVPPSTPCSRKRTKRSPEAHSSSSNVGRSKVLDALDVSEPMFLREVLNRILKMPDLAGISRNRTKPAVCEVTQPQARDACWNESYPTSIVFRGLKNSSTKRSTTYLEEPTVYGTLFEQADPWDTIGQILGLPNTKTLRSPGEVVDEFSEIDWSEASFETSSAVVEAVSDAEITQQSETGDIEDEQLFIGSEYESTLATPELEELDGHFIGPSLFELEDEL